MEPQTPGHIPLCNCVKCRTSRLSHQVYPESVRNVGLFRVGTAPTKLADLTDASGVKLSAFIPASALIVSLRSIGLQDGEVALTKGVGNQHLLAFQETVEFSLDDLDTHIVQAETEGNDVVISYTVLMSPRA